MISAAVHLATRGAPERTHEPEGGCPLRRDNPRGFESVHERVRAKQIRCQASEGVVDAGKEPS